MAKHTKKAVAGKKAGSAPPKVRVTIRHRIVLQSIFLTTLTALILSLSAFFTTHFLIEQRILLQLQSIVGAKEELIARRIDADRERTALLGRDADIQNILSGVADKRLLEEILAVLQEEGIPVLGISIYNQNNSVLHRAGLSVTPVSTSLHATTLVPWSGEEGWEGYTIYSPVRSGKLHGVVGVRYSLRDFLQSVLLVPSLGETGEVLIGKKENGELILLNHEFAPGRRSPLSLGAFDQLWLRGEPIAMAIDQNEGAGLVSDYAGSTVFAAYRSLPRLGWGLVVSIHRDEAMRGIVYMALALAVKSLLLMVIASYVAMILANRLTLPLRRLTEKMSKLGPGNWSLHRSTNTGDEVELLEHITVDMANRLQGLYENLEDTVEERTKKLEEQFLKEKTILETIDHGVILVNAKGMITEANPASLALMKCNGDACTSRKIEDILDIRINHQSVSKASHPVRKALSARTAVRSSPDKRFSIMNSDNILVPVLMVIKPLMEGKKLIGAVAVFHDVTEERRVDYLKSEFISLASHQLRTPLASLQWYLELINDTKHLNKEQKEYVKEMDIASKRMSNLIDALLHAARLEGGDITPHTNAVELTSLIADLGEELRTMAKSKKITTEISVPKKKVEVETDSVLLHVIFRNLFSNAVKYTQKGGKVSVSMKATKTAVTIAVADNGIGIPKAAKKRLFQRLFRADNVRKMDTDGNGLGLYISKMIVTSLGGTITAKSTEGKGSTFTVKLPIKKRKKK